MTERVPGFWGLVRADLLRNRILLKGTPASGTRLWSGMCAPRFVPVLLCRIMGWFAGHRLGVLAKVVSLVNYSLFGLEIAARCRIGPGLFLPHTHGTVIGAFAIGANAVIYQGVTLGAKDLDFTFDAAHRPVLGDNVIIGAGAVIIGGLMIGDGAKIGANAVVTRSVAAGQTMVGIPARPLTVKSEVRSSDGG